MITIYVVKANQNLTDIALQEYGHIDGVFALIEDNNAKIRSVDERIEAGLELVIDSEKVINTGLVEYFKKKKVFVGTGLDMIPYKSFSGKAFSKAFN